MKASTAAELAGFACLSAAGFAWRSIPVGLVVTGLCLLLIGLATEDTAAEIAIGRVVGPVRAHRARVKAQRIERRAQKRESRRRHV